MFNVLKPNYVAIGDWYVVKWIVLGVVADMAEAKKLYGGSPVLEEVKK